MRHRLTTVLPFKIFYFQLNDTIAENNCQIFFNVFQKNSGSTINVGVQEKLKVDFGRKKARSSFALQGDVNAKKQPKSCFFVVERGGFEPPKSLTTDLQSAPFGHSGISPYGAGDWTRTHNLLITNQLLCQLSYTSIHLCVGLVPRDGIEPSTQGFSVPCSTD